MGTEQTKTVPDFLEYSLTVGMATMEGRGFYYPVDTALGKDGRLYVVSHTLENPTGGGVRVTMCNVGGEYFGTFGPYGEGDGQFIWPPCGAVDSEGRVYISDEHTSRISVFEASGQFLSKWGTQGSREGELDTPSGIAFDGQSSLYVSDTHNSRIQVFTKDGRYLRGFGAKGEADGQLNLPWGVTIDAKGDVYVADWGNDRIQNSHLMVSISPSTARRAAGMAGSIVPPASPWTARAIST